MAQFVHIGYGNMVNADRVDAIVSPDGAPIKRLVQNAKETGNAVDATQGRKTKAVLVMADGQVILSALLPETIAARTE
ncbi:MAG: DUF370 domain-containing protein [Lachnospiraceae bacterium]|nr:DUF370 domain-containing protein [Lachnospiraceae bacterium]